ncbi:MULTISPECIES: phosphatase PAP2 family protein [Flavobacteriaceae]|uniref:Phosphatase PAP2 family protein n=2 Tax=Flavobacteriaceae TaxID=49546 RepID=A0A4Y8AY14_9FLAO|nr:MULTISPECIES: phosphatase PAP2 family protein [Flavobacteriaceae]TEW76854.1 phosphatase PAP2 family protein [Gramella jeungdoensis]GGK49488.1 phosphatase PAP2 family protein [Lutibacter litoralis]
MIDSIIDKDIELLIFLNNLGTTQWDGFWLIITNKFSAIPLYILLLYLIFKYYGLKRTVVLVLFVVVLIAVSDQTSNLFKYGFKRLRPCHDENIAHLIRLVKERCGGLYSYFSAHASNAMAIAVFFSFLLKDKVKYLSYFLIIWAVFVAYSRIYIGVHFTLDVLTGAIIGGLYATLCYKLFKLVDRKFFT